MRKTKKTFTQEQFIEWGRKGGKLSGQSKIKAQTSGINGKKGGRPKKKV